MRFFRRKKTKKTQRKGPTLKSERVTAGLRKKQPKRNWKKFAKRAAAPAAIAFLFLTLLLIYDIPNLEALTKVEKTPAITMQAEDGMILATYGDFYGDFIPSHKLPKQLVQALLATEDRNFYHHFGIDPIGILRAMFVNIKAGRVVEGGSTVTQQLAKNVFLTQERTLRRKLQEVILAFVLEYKFSKNQILTFYFNRMYLGAGTYGVDAAARRYFDKSARELNLYESAMIIGLLKAPSRYAPTNNYDRTRERAAVVLDNMVEAGYLTQKQADAAKKKRIEPALYRKSSQENLYFTDWVLDQIPDLIGPIREDISVTITLVPKFQKLAEESVEALLKEKGTELQVSQAALIALGPDGAVKAMVGGANYHESPFNRAVQAKRQPGSAFKLFVYLAALQSGFTPDDRMEDKPVSIGKWQPKNYDGKYRGEVTLREAFAESINTVAAQLTDHVGPGRVADIAHRLGIQSELMATPSIALGSSEVSLLELTSAYDAVATGGRTVTPYAIVEIKNAKGKTLYRFEPPSESVVLDSATVARANDLLTAVVQTGTGRGAAIGRPVAGKTGTSQDFRDAYFIGFVPQLTTGVWVGNDDNTPMKKVTGGNMPASIFRKFMSGATSGMAAADISTEAGFFSRVYHGGAPSQASGAGEGDVDLGNNFWDKLFSNNPEAGKIEYDYPGQRPQ